MRIRIRRPGKASGATYIEAATSLLIFLTCIFFFIDAARYFYIQTVLNYAVHAGVDLASKMELEVSTTETDCASAACDDIENPCAKFLKRWERVTQKVQDLADTVTTPWGTAGPAQRVEFEHYYDSSGETPQSHACLSQLDSDVVFLRPGEIVRSKLDPSVKYEIPTRPFSAGVNTPAGWPQSGESWVRLLRDNPFGIRIDVQFQPVTPFFKPITMHVEQYGHRLTRAVGAYLPVLPTVAPTAVATPTGTPPTPTITPGGPTITPEPTATGTPATPTPTSAPTIAPTPYPTYSCACCRPVITAPCTFTGCIDNCSGAG